MRKTSIFMAVCLLFLISTLLTANSGGSESKGISSDEALRKLKEGNERFVQGKYARPHTGSDRRLETVKNGQQPFAVILSCADSRVPLEHIFDAGIGDLFVIRVAGNVADTDEIGTIEYGVEHLGASLVVVLGHSKCGAVTAVAKHAHVTDNIRYLVDNIVPAVKKTEMKLGKDVNDGFVDEAIHQNIFQAIEDIMLNSPLLHEFFKKNKAQVVGAYYDLSTGKVDWLGSLPNQTAFLNDNAPEAFFEFKKGPFLIFILIFILELLIFKLFISKNRLVKSFGIRRKNLAAMLSLIIIPVVSYAVVKMFLFEAIKFNLFWILLIALAEIIMGLTYAASITKATGTLVKTLKEKAGIKD